VSADCSACGGLAWQATEWIRESGGWSVLGSEPCSACLCYDCAIPAGEYELVIRGNQRVPVCIECYVESGDDNQASCLMHDKER
jgi:hypothetical protein